MHVPPDQRDHPECFQGWDVHHLSGQPVPVFYHLRHKNFLISNLNWPSFRTFVPLQQALLKSLAPSHSAVLKCSSWWAMTMQQARDYFLCFLHSVPSATNFGVLWYRLWKPMIWGLFSFICLGICMFCPTKTCLPLHISNTAHFRFAWVKCVPDPICVIYNKDQCCNTSRPNGSGQG